MLQFDSSDFPKWIKPTVIEYLNDRFIKVTDDDFNSYNDDPNSVSIITRRLISYAMSLYFAVDGTDPEIERTWVWHTKSADFDQMRLAIAITICYPTLGVGGHRLTNAELEKWREGTSSAAKKLVACFEGGMPDSMTHTVLVGQRQVLLALEGKPVFYGQSGKLAGVGLRAEILSVLREHIPDTELQHKLEHELYSRIYGYMKGNGVRPIHQRLTLSLTIPTYVG